MKGCPLKGHDASPCRVRTHWTYLLRVKWVWVPSLIFCQVCVLCKGTCWIIISTANICAIQENPTAKNKICLSKTIPGSVGADVSLFCRRYIWGFVDRSEFALKVGEGSRLRCWLWVLDGLDRSPVEWRLNGSSVQPWQAQISEGSLTLLNATHSMEGNYSCHDDRGTLLQTIKLRLGRKSASAIQESLVFCFNSKRDSFDKICSMFKVWTLWFILSANVQWKVPIPKNLTSSALK